MAMGCISRQPRDLPRQWTSTEPLNMLASAKAGDRLHRRELYKSSVGSSGEVVRDGNSPARCVLLCFRAVFRSLGLLRLLWHWLPEKRPENKEWTKVKLCRRVKSQVMVNLTYAIDFWDIFPPSEIDAFCWDKRQLQNWDETAVGTKGGPAPAASLRRRVAEVGVGVAPPGSHYDDLP